MNKLVTWSIIVLAVSVIGNRQSSTQQTNSENPLSWNLLVPDSASLARGWEFPRDPRVDTAGLSPQVAHQVLRGFLLFTDTYAQAERFAGGKVTCNHCHPNGGQREKALPLVGVDKVFPEYNPRSGRLFTLEERIVGCMLRSINATGRANQNVVLHHENELEGATLSPVSSEIQDLAAYIRWLSWNRDIDSALPWRGQNTLSASARIPLEKLDPRLGQHLFVEKCANCHGEDGQGMFIGDKRPGPLWGPESWNDGAGAARTYTLAGFILNWMPYMNPGSLTTEEAQHIAAYITSQPRAHFPYQDNDYLTTKIPVDAVYYKKLYSQNPLSKK